MDLKYFYFTGHWRKQLNFTWEALASAAEALGRMKLLLAKYKSEKDRTVLSEAKLGKIQTLRGEFVSAVMDDLNMPQALAIAWKAMKSNVPGMDKYDLLMDFDQIFGLGIGETSVENIPQDVMKLSKERDVLRAEGNYKKADKLRAEIENMGYVVEDDGDVSRVRKMLR